MTCPANILTKSRRLRNILRRALPGVPLSVFGTLKNGTSVPPKAVPYA
jgi:hypothetical protein